MELRRLNADQWREAWGALPPACRDVYYHPAYVTQCARWERASAHCVRVGDGEGWLLYPYLAHSIQGTDRHDIQTAYGYGGPIFAGEWPAERRVAALRLSGEYLRSDGAVAEFVRCHTQWTDVEALDGAGFSVFRVRTNVECELNAQDVMASWSAGARRNVRKARASGMSWRAGEGPRDWDAFERLYEQTAARLAMGPGYRFDRVYFQGLARVPGVRLLMVELGAKAVAGAVVFIGGELAHYHLGASDFTHQQARPNDLLYLAMAEFARESGSRRIIWGGGLSDDPGDTLFRFKLHFGAIQRGVFCAGRVIDKRTYEELCRAWERKNAGRASKMFLRYRG